MVGGSLKLFVEGGGQSKLLKTACRSGFSKFLGKAGLTGSMPRIVACGSRQNAYDSFCTALENGESALLLIDSEAAVAPRYQPGTSDRWLPWHHLKDRQGDGWIKPDGARNLDCHLMVQCMEAWFLADRVVLQDFFGQGFNVGALPIEQNNIESVAKETIYQSLYRATKDCKTKKPYGKGEHSFKLLALIDPEKVRAGSRWADRFITFLHEVKDGQW